MILRNPEKLKVYIRVGFTDMRKSWNGLYGLVKEEMNLDPYNHCLFLFSGRSRKLVKVFYWDGNGFCIWQKKLQEGSFHWPDDTSEKVTLSGRELKWLLKGIDFRKEHKEIFFTED